MQVYDKNSILTKNNRWTPFFQRGRKIDPLLFPFSFSNYSADDKPAPLSYDFYS